MIDHEIKKRDESMTVRCSCGRLTPYVAPMYVHRCDKCRGIKQASEKNDKFRSTK